MILNEHNILHYLLGRGLVTPSAAVDGDIRIVQGDRRHRHFRIERSQGTGLFVKQVRQWDPQTTSCLQRESICYRLAAQDGAFASLRGRVPVYRDYDPSSHILTAEFFAEASNMTQLHGRLGTAPIEVAEDLGEMLGCWHREIRITPGDPRFGDVFPGRLPWILVMHRQPPQASHPDGQGALFVCNTLSQDPVLRQAMEGLVQGYKPTCLIHGDVKWDNILVLGEAAPEATERSTRMVDWEIADFGDPLWDVGGVFQSYLGFWLLSMPLASGVLSAQIEQQANFPLSTAQPALRAFWNAYRDAREMADDEAEEALRTSLRYAAARLTQTAYEAGVTYRQAIPQLRFMMQLSQNLLLKTDNAIHDLLGI